MTSPWQDEPHHVRELFRQVHEFCEAVSRATDDALNRLRVSGQSVFNEATDTLFDFIADQQWVWVKTALTQLREMGYDPQVAYVPLRAHATTWVPPMTGCLSRAVITNPATPGFGEG